jgi:hypothetical protein
VLRSAPKGRPLRADVAQALLGSGGRRDGGEVLGHSPLNQLPEPALEDLVREVPILPGSPIVTSTWNPLIVCAQLLPGGAPRRTLALSAMREYRQRPTRACAASHKTEAADRDNYCVGWVRNSPLLTQKRTLWADSVPERSSPKKQNLLLRSRCSLCFRARRSLWCFTCFSTGFYTGATTRLLRWGWGCGLGSGSLRRARRRCRVSSKNARISDKAEDRSYKHYAFYHGYIWFLFKGGPFLR